MSGADRVKREELGEGFALNSRPEHRPDGQRLCVPVRAVACSQNSRANRHVGTFAYRPPRSARKMRALRLTVYSSAE